MNLVVCKAFLVIICSSLILASQSDGPIDTTSGQYPFHEVLEPNYELKWKFNSTHIVFQTRVKTNGYIGFGISGNGAMYPSDVVIGWVHNGQVHFADRHATGHSMPVKDTHQDWHLLHGEETGDYTTLTMIRKLDTCDSDDIAIKEGTTRVIYSYSPSDPTSDDNISYHGASRRGTKSMLLLDPPTGESASQALPSDVKTIDFLNKNYTVPGKDTMYSCSMWKLPDLGEKHHMIRYEPVIQKGHELLLHHIILYFCTNPFDDSMIGHKYECYHNVPQQARSCNHVFVAWAIGGTGFNYPAHVGHSLGTSRDPGYFVMETHYDNPDMRSDFVDNSGIRIFLTKQLRQYDAGILEAGVHVDSNQIVPPYNSHFLSQGFCHQGCLAEAFGDQEVKVFANMLHAHLIGRKLRTRIIRNGVEIEPLQEDNNYDFNFQESRRLPEERVLKKGDALIVECDYDSSQRTRVTFGGLSSREEMCLSFLLYYPRTSINGCWSRTNYHIPKQFAGRSVHSIVNHLDWTQQEVQDEFAKVAHDSPEYYACQGDSHNFNFATRLEPKLKVNKSYDQPKTCP